jgi:hypothetical protein
LLNAELIAAGKSVLGFMNPFIYANPGVFTDITTGSNPGCNTNGFPVCACVASVFDVEINTAFSRPEPGGIL